MRHNIYLPDDLSRAVQEASISISAVCQAALKAEVQKVNAHRAATTDLERIAGRLRKTQSEDDARLEDLGHRLGVRWARDFATWRDLDELTSDAGPGRDNGVWEWLEEQAREGGYDLEQDVAGVDRWPGSAFLSGFLDGAVEVFEAVGPLM